MRATSGRESRRPAGGINPSRRAAAGLGLAALVALAAPAAALTPAELVGPDLRPRAVSLAGIAEGQISFFDEDRRLRREPLEAYVQVRAIGGAAASGPVLESAAPAWFLELMDGQRLVGDWLGASDDGGILWRHGALDEVSVPLEAARRVGRLGEAEAQPRIVSADGDAEVAQDEVVLSNGDRLRGFIAELGSEGLSIEPEGGSQAVTLSLERVVELRLANAASESQAPLPGDCLVELGDGSRLLASDLVVSGERAAFQPRVAPAGGLIDLPLSQVRRIDFVGAGWQLVDLAGQPLAVTGGGDAFGVTRSPRVERADVLLHAPVDVDFTLPDTATRLAATAALDLDEVSAMAPREWADFEVVIPAADADAGGVPTAETRYRLNQAHPVQSINLPVSGGKLLVRLESGVNGPVLDRLRLSDAVVLLKRPAAPADSDAATAP